MLTIHCPGSTRKNKHKIFKVDWFGGVCTDIPPVATLLQTGQLESKLYRSLH